MTRNENVIGRKTQLNINIKTTNVLVQALIIEKAIMIDFSFNNTNLKDLTFLVLYLHDEEIVLNYSKENAIR